ncbi:VOC family protein [Deinococcus sp. KSM4-11]|uniref:VOC family protein n=1 Tax=Deinococcus sp. KSM4-11 TaxID=2568654 RepID=UPI0010A503B6|nr:VOC family protein [Deinococcus sp. KSM4-11]THF88004.1 VOC family protein [Deinococcus sp. KSM4-11]
MIPDLSASTHVRLARPSLNLTAAERFYVEGLGLSVLYRSAEDAFADLLMLGIPGAGWHLELTRPRKNALQPTPTGEDLLVLYLGRVPDPETLARLEDCGGRRVPAENPYWEQWGVTIADPDGYRLVLCQRSWSA